MTITDWQSEFLRRFTEASSRKSLLLAPTGVGKTTVGLQTVRALLDRKLTDVAIILTAHRVTARLTHRAAQHAVKSIRSVWDSVRASARRIE